MLCQNSLQEEDKTFKSLVSTNGTFKNVPFAHLELIRCYGNPTVNGCSVVVEGKSHKIATFNVIPSSDPKYCFRIGIST